MVYWLDIFLPIYDPGYPDMPPVVIGISPCSRDVFAPLLNKLVYVLDSLMAGHYIWRRDISF